MGKARCGRLVYSGWLHNVRFDWPRHGGGSTRAWPRRGALVALTPRSAVDGVLVECRDVRLGQPRSQSFQG